MNYKECVFTSDPHTVADDFCQQLENCQKDIINRGALPIFCTIPNMNIAVYHNFMLTHRKTSFLKHQEDYQKMQENLEIALSHINSEIPKINKKIQYTTILKLKQG